MVSRAELADITYAAQYGPFSPYYDADCDGSVTNADVGQVSANLGSVPDCSTCTSFMGGDDAEVDDAALAEALKSLLTAEQLDQTIAHLEEVCATWTGTPLGDEMAGLLAYLK